MLAFTKLRSAVKELGLYDTFWYLIDISLLRLSNHRLRLRKYYFIAQPVHEKELISRSRTSSFVVREVFSDDPYIRLFPRPHDVIQSRFAQGTRCLAAFQKDTFVGFIWLALGNYQEDEVRCRFIPSPQGKAAWDFDIYVEPKYRISTAFTRLWDAANAFLRERGITCTMSRISAFNSKSLSVHIRMGGKCIGSAYFLLVGPFQITFTIFPPYFHFSRGPRSFPEIVLRENR